MKKTIIVWAYLFVLSLGTILSLSIPKNEAAAKEAVVIPGQAIRLRILANSDLEADQVLKRHVRDAVNAKISVWVKNLTSMKEAKKVIQAKLPEIQATAEETVKQQGSRQAVKVKFGQVSFPTKLYGDFLYPAGKYQAILITLGEGKGANWWCVLFPPLCFLDFSNGVAVSKGFEEGRQHPAEPNKQTNASSVEPMDRASDQGKAQTANEGQMKASASRSENREQKEKAGSGGNPESKRAVATGQGQDAKQTAAADRNQDAKQTAAADPNQSQQQSQSAGNGQAAVQKQPKKAAMEVGDPQTKTDTPVYTPEDEQPIQVKFFVVELWNKLFN